MNQDFTTKISVGDLLGDGYFGRVHKAEHHILGTVAVKFLKRRNNESDDRWESRRANLIHEGQKLKKAEHENVVRVYDVVKDPDSEDLMIIMEFCEQGSAEALYMQGPLHLHTLRWILSDITRGLDAIHSRGLIHKDSRFAHSLSNSTD